MAAFSPMYSLGHLPPVISRPMPATSPSVAAWSYVTYVVRVHARNGIKTLSFDSLAAYFTCTSKQAAEELGISSRTLIRVCRSLGIRRWPYLSFRSEKDIERIRHEAMDNLRRLLEKRGGVVAPVDSSNALVRRGASANRLLKLTAPGQTRPTLLHSFDNAHFVDLTDYSDADHDHTRTYSEDEGDFTDSCGGLSDDGSTSSPLHSAMAQPYPSKISPRKDGVRVIPSLRRVIDTTFLNSPQSMGHSRHCQTWSPSVSPLRCPPPRSRAMSMHDILSASST